MTPLVIVGLVFAAVAAANWIDRDRDGRRGLRRDPRTEATTHDLLDALRAAHGGEIVHRHGAHVLRIVRGGIDVLLGAIRGPMGYMVTARATWALPPGPPFSLTRRTALDVHPPLVLGPRLDAVLRASHIGVDLARVLVAIDESLLQIDELQSDPGWIEARVASRDAESIGPGIDVVARIARLGTEPLVEIADREGATLRRDADGVPVVELGSDAGTVRVRGVASVTAYLAGAREICASVACDRSEAAFACRVGEDGALTPTIAEVAEDPRAADPATRAGRFELARSGGELRIAWPSTPSSVELRAGIELLAALASQAPRQGVFR